MRITGHIAATVPAAVVFYGLTRSCLGAIGVLLSGILIDVDHFVDYWHDCGFNFDIKRFFRYASSPVHTTYYIPLHSFELLVIPLIGVKLSFYPYFFAGLMVGLVLHLFLDYVAALYKCCGKWNTFILYFFTFRLLLGFQRNSIDPVCKKTGTTP